MTQSSLNDQGYEKHRDFRLGHRSAPEKTGPTGYPLWLVDQGNCEPPKELKAAEKFALRERGDDAQKRKETRA